MAKNSSTTATQETPARSTSIDLGPDRASALAAAYDGVYHIFGGRVENWDVTEDGLVANGFTVNGEFDPEAVLAPIVSHVRRAPLMPTLGWIMGKEPDHFANAQAVTTFTVQYYKGTDGGSDSTRVAEWVRKAAQAYKASRPDFYQKRGPKAKGITFKNLAEVNPETLLKSDVDISGLEHLIAVASAALESRRTESAPTTDEAVEA